jgi:hypothetical protein
MKRISWRRKAVVAHAAAPAAGSPADTAAKKPLADADLLEGTSTWMKALQLTAVLAVAGYIGKISVQQLLGIELGNWRAEDLSIFAGGWAVDTVSRVLDGILSHPFAFGLPVLLYVALPTLVLSLPKSNRFLMPLTYAGIGVAAAALLVILIWFQAPTLAIKDWLTTELSQQLTSPSGGLLARREAEMKTRLLVSKMDGVAKQYTIACPFNPPDVLRPYLKANDPAKAAGAYLDLVYASCVVICGAAWLVLYFRPPEDEPGPIDDIFRGLRLLICFVLLPLCALMIPYMYGKLIYPTTFPLVSVSFSNEDPHKDLLLMDETDKEITLLSTKDSVPFMVQIRRRDEITEIHRFGEEDIFNVMLLQCKWDPSGTSAQVDDLKGHAFSRAARQNRGKRGFSHRGNANR